MSLPDRSLIDPGSPMHLSKSSTEPGTARPPNPRPGNQHEPDGPSPRSRSQRAESLRQENFEPGDLRRPHRSRFSACLSSLLAGQTISGVTTPGRATRRGGDQASGQLPSSHSRRRGRTPGRPARSRAGIRVGHLPAGGARRPSYTAWSRVALPVFEGPFLLPGQFSSHCQPPRNPNWPLLSQARRSGHLDLEVNAPWSSCRIRATRPACEANGAGVRHDVGPNQTSGSDSRSAVLHGHRAPPRAAAWTSPVLRSVATVRPGSFLACRGHEQRVRAR